MKVYKIQFIEKSSRVSLFWNTLYFPANVKDIYLTAFITYKVRMWILYSLHLLFTGMTNCQQYVTISLSVVPNSTKVKDVILERNAQISYTIKYTVYVFTVQYRMTAAMS